MGEKRQCVLFHCVLFFKLTVELFLFILYKERIAFGAKMRILFDMVTRHKDVIVAILKGPSYKPILLVIRNLIKGF